MDIPRVKTIFLSVVILTSLFAFVTPFQNSFESEYTRSISTPSTVVTFRDIGDTCDTVDPIVSLDRSNYSIGNTATLTVTDANADVRDGFAIGEEDTITAVVTMSSSTTVTLTETSAGFFEGTFTIDAAPSVDYTPDSPEAARAQITLPVNPGGGVILGDVTFTESEIVNLGIRPVTGAVDITLSGGASFTSVPTVEISFVNTNLGGTFDATKTVYLVGCSDVSVGDVRLANAGTKGFADGSTVLSGATDVGDFLTPFAPNVKHDGADKIFDVGETIYLASDSTVSVGDTRLANAGTKGFADGSTVLSGATDVGDDLVAFALNEQHDAGGSVLDIEMWHKAPTQGWEQITQSCNTRLALFLPCTFFDIGTQTITSDPDGDGFDFTDGQGQYVLAFDTGIPGGGGGGLVRPGLVVNALAGIGGAGGGGGLPGPTIALCAVALSDRGSELISLPQEIRDFINDDFDPHTPLEPIIDIYEDFDLPLSINGNGFVLCDYENTLVPQAVEPGKPIEFTLVFYTKFEVAHTSLNFNLGPTRTIAGSDTQVLLYKDKFEIVDPNGNIASATGSINNEGDLKRVATFSITFSDSVQWSNSDLVMRSWNDNLNSGDIIVYDAIAISQPEVVEIADEDIPEPEIQTLKSQHVPIWIKNNAAWWSQELIEDSDFVAGIEYLIQQEIITIQDNEIIAASYSSNEIPEWIKNNAGWWSEDLITEKEFIDGLQWLISNGIIQVAET